MTKVSTYLAAVVPACVLGVDFLAEMEPVIFVADYLRFMILYFYLTTLLNEGLAFIKTN